MENKITKESLTLSEVISLIDRIAGDEFCADIECDYYFHPEKLTAREKLCYERLSDIYIVAHSHNQEAGCYEAHEGWRKESAMKIQEKYANVPE